jgi:hypothetical protein
VHQFIEMWQSPVTRRIVRQAPHMRIVAAVVRRSLLGDLRRPGLKGQAAGKTRADIARQR